MMDLGYLVIAVVLGLLVMIIRGFRGRWNGKRDDYRHNPLPGHRQDGGPSEGGGVD